MIKQCTRVERTSFSECMNYGCHYMRWLNAHWMRLLAVPLTQSMCEQLHEKMSSFTVIASIESPLRQDKIHIVVIYAIPVLHWIKYEPAFRLLLSRTHIETSCGQKIWQKSELKVPSLTFLSCQTCRQSKILMCVLDTRNLKTGSHSAQCIVLNASILFLFTWEWFTETHRNTHSIGMLEIHIKEAMRCRMRANTSREPAKVYINSRARLTQITGKTN